MIIPAKETVKSFLVLLQEPTYRSGSSKTRSSLDAGHHRRHLLLHFHALHFHAHGHFVVRAAAAATFSTARLSFLRETTEIAVDHHGRIGV